MFISLRAATGLQLQEAAKYARLQDSVNQVGGLVQAMFCSVPSPMQERILRRGLTAVGYPYLKVTECVRPATTADRAPEMLHAAIKNMVKAFGAADDPRVSEPRIAGSILYVTIPTNGFAESAHLVSRVLGQRDKKSWTKLPYLDKHHLGWSRTVRIDRKNWTAVVEAAGVNVRLSAYKGVQ